MSQLVTIIWHVVSVTTYNSCKWDPIMDILLLECVYVAALVDTENV